MVHARGLRKFGATIAHCAIRSSKTRAQKFLKKYMSYKIDRVKRVGHLGGLQFGVCESSGRCFEIPSRDNVLRAFCFLYEMEPDVHVTLLGELRLAN